MKQLTIRRPDDMHLHVRQGQMLKTVVPLTSAHFGRAIIMPNTVPPITTAEQVKEYRQEIERAVPKGDHFQPLMTFKVVPTIRPESIAELKQAGVVAGKLYPEGVTTNSEDGVRDISAIYPVFAAMQEQGVILCLHGERPGSFCLDREKEFLPYLTDIVSAFPRLKVVLEHITTAAAAELVAELPERVAATITAHHLVISLDDVIGDKIRPHHFCKPIAKRPEDREALLRVATSGSPKFFLGTDSAPHAIETKECAEGCAGVFTAPLTMPLMATVFEEAGALDKLEAFTSINGAEFYGLPLSEEKLTLEKAEMKVPEQYGSVVPFLAGKPLPWRVKK